MYFKPATQTAFTSHSEIRTAHPDVSFPLVMTDDTLEAHGIHAVTTAPQPAHDPITQAVRETAPVLTDKGHWEQQWEVVALDADAIAANQATVRAARKTAILAELATIDLKSIRALREGYQPKIDELDAQAAALRAEMAAL